MSEVNTETEEANEFELFDEAPAAEESQQEESTAEELAQQEQEEVAAKQEEAAPLTPEAITAAVKEGLAPEKPEEKVEEKELTQEEIDAYLKTAKYTADDLKLLGLIPEDLEAVEADRRVAGFNELIQRSVQQSVATSQMLLQHQTGQLNEQINPIIEAHRAQQQAAMVDTFYSKYESLKEYEEIVKIASTNAISEKKLEGKTFDETCQIIATDAASLVKKFSGVDINLSATTKSPVKKEVVTEHKVTPAGTSSGGRSQQQTQEADKNEGTGEFDIY